MADKREAFNKVFDDLLAFIVEDARANEVPEHHIEYLKRLVEYNVQGGKLNRGLSIPDTLIILKKNQQTDEELYLSRVLGWCVEWLQAFFLVADDIMDASVTRRSQPCWYKLEDVGLLACNDFLLLEAHIYRILKKYFRHLPYYVDLLELLQDTTFQTELGQLNDIRMMPPNMTKIDFSKFTIETYKLIVKYKTAFYSFYLPIAAGLILAGITDKKIFDLTQEICVQMGEYFQIQDDYLDCYADPEVLGKVGRDIEEGKCCWLVVQALQRVNEEQRKLLETSYGVDDAEHVKKIKQLYEDLNIQQIYKDYEATRVKELHQLIDQIGADVDKSIFLSLLSKIENRTK